MTMTARQILAKTPQSRRSDYVKLEQNKVLRRKDGSMIVKAKTYSTHDIGDNRKSPPYTRYITTAELNKKAVKVSCSCDDFWSVWEYALTKKGAADIEYCNGNPPNIKNPTQVPGTCIAEGEKVKTSRGLIPIENVEIGDSVLTLKGYRSVLESSLTREDTEVLELKTDTGKSVKVTPEHQVLTIKKDAYKASWVEARLLKEGDILLSILPEEPSILKTYDPEAATLGILLAETGEKGFKPLDIIVKKTLQIHYKNWKGKTIPLNTHSISNHPIIASLAKQYKFKINSRKKTLPNWIWEKDYNFKRWFLYGLFMGDGWIAKDGNASTIATSSKKLAKDLQMLLWDFGVFSSISKEVSGIQDTQMWLVRPTSKGTQTIIKILPKLEKYKINDTSVRTSTKENRTYLNLEELVKYFRLECFKYDTPEIDYEDEYVVVRHYLTSGVDTTLKFLKDNYGDFLKKTKILGSKKPSIAAPKSLVDYVRYITVSNNRKNSVDVPSFEWTPKQKVRDWLDTLDHPAITVQIEHLRTILNDNVVMEPIVRIQKTKADVYDLTIDSVEHFTANGFVVHNCKHVYRLLTKLIDKGLL